MATWDQIEADKRYIASSTDKKRSYRKKFFQTKILPEMQKRKFDADKQTQIATQFLLHPDTQVENDHPAPRGIIQKFNEFIDASKDIGFTGFGDIAAESLIQFPATTAILGSHFLKGISFGNIDLDPKNAREFLQNREETMGVTTFNEKKAGKVAEIAGEFYPIGALFKASSLIVNSSKFVMTPAVNAFMRSSIVGMTYAYMKGTSEGKAPMEVVKDMGVDGLTFAAFDGLIAKIFAKSPVASEEALKKIQDAMGWSRDKVINHLPPGVRKQLTAGGNKVSEGVSQNLSLPTTIGPARKQLGAGAPLVGSTPKGRLAESPTLLGQAEQKFGKPFADRLKLALDKKPFERDALDKVIIKKANQIFPDKSRLLDASGKALDGVDEIATNSISLYSGIPLPEITKALKALRGKIGTKYRKGGDLGPFQSLIGFIHSPSYLAGVHPVAKQIVESGVNSFLFVRKRMSNSFIQIRDKAIKDLSEGEQFIVAQMLDKYDSSKDIPVEVSKQLHPKLLQSFTTLREHVYNPIARMAGIGTEGQPGKVKGYLTRVFKDLDTYPKAERKQMIASFADDNGLKFKQAEAILEGSASPELYFPPIEQIGKKGFFGPLSKSRTKLENDPRRIFDLRFLTDMYIHGSARKISLDKFLPEATNLLKQIPEGTNIRRMMVNYINIQKGKPLNFDQAARGSIYGKIARFEAIRQFTSKIGGNIGSSIINATQYPINDGTLAISEMIKTRSTGPAVDFAKGAMAIFTKRGRTLAHRSGVTLDVGRGELSLKDLRGAWAKTAEVSGTLFSAVEKYNKTASYIRNFNKMQRDLKGLKGLTNGEKYHMARRGSVEGVGRTQFHVGVEDRPSFFLGPAGGTIGRFKIFTIKQLEFIANMDGAELASFVGILDLIGGPDVLPGVRELRYSLNENHPDAMVTKVLNGMQKFSVAGASGTDLSGKVGLGFVPGVSTSRSFWSGVSTDFWGQVGDFLEGPTVGDIKNLLTDIDSGRFNMDSFEMRDLMDFESQSTLPIGVQIKRTSRAIKERENGYIEFRRKRPGYALQGGDVFRRFIGLEPAGVARQKQVASAFRDQIKEATDKKIKLEDRVFKLDDQLYAEKDPEKRRKIQDVYDKVFDEMFQFNEKYYEQTGVKISGASMNNAYRQRHLSYEQRFLSNKRLAEQFRQMLDRHQK